MKPMLVAFVAASAALIYVLGTTPVFAQDVQPIQVRESDKGRILTDENGSALYTSDMDSKNKSMCNGACLEQWEPLVADETAAPNGTFDLFDRGDGMMQWSHNGRPLYISTSKNQPGDTSLDGADGTWRVAKP